MRFSIQFREQKPASPREPTLAELYQHKKWLEVSIARERKSNACLKQKGLEIRSRLGRLTEGTPEYKDLHRDLVSQAHMIKAGEVVIDQYAKQLREVVAAITLKKIKNAIGSRKEPERAGIRKLADETAKVMGHQLEDEPIGLPNWYPDSFEDPDADEIVEEVFGEMTEELGQSAADRLAFLDHLEPVAEPIGSD